WGRRSGTSSTTAAPGSPFLSRASFGVSFGVAQRLGHQEALVFVPKDWPAMAAANPLLQLGAVVFVGSQAVDFATARIGRDSSTKIKDRAQAYEAEYLRSFGLEAELDAYQKDLLKRWPRFPPRLDYRRKEIRGPN